jgi:4-hydroxybenzoate polyprenyltransferase
MIIAGSGYVINDMFDVTTDKVNKPARKYIPDVISFQKARIYYVTLVLTGFVLSLYIAFQINFESHLWIYPMAVGLLYIYARKLKSTVLAGNIIVSLFVGMVWGILFYIQGADEAVDSQLMDMGYGFSFLGFMSNFMREIIKDAEDLKGDKMSGIKTLPSVLGLSVTKRVVFSLGFAFILFLVYALIFWKNTFEWTMYILFIISFVAGIMIKTVRAHKKSDYTEISRHLKVLMVLGLLGIYLASRI